MEEDTNPFESVSFALKTLLSPIQEGLREVKFWIQWCIEHYNSVEKKVSKLISLEKDSRRRLAKAEQSIRYLKGVNQGLISRCSRNEKIISVLSEKIRELEERYDDMDSDLESLEDDYDSMNETLQRTSSKAEFLNYLPEALIATMQSFRKMEPVASRSSTDNSYCNSYDDVSGPHKDGQECTGPNCYHCESDDA